VLMFLFCLRNLVFRAKSAIVDSAVLADASD
jgi:hypothetical protein